MRFYLRTLNLWLKWVGLCVVVRTSDEAPCEICIIRGRYPMSNAQIAARLERVYSSGPNRGRTF